MVATASIAAIGALAAAVGSDAAPTGGEVTDILLRSGVVVATVLAATRARRRTLAAAATLVAIGSGGWNVALGALALLVVFVLAVRDVRSRAAGAVVGGLIGWCALQLVWPTTTGASALLAALALAPMWWSGYRVARSRTRRHIRRGAVALAVLTLLGLVGAAAVVVTQEGRIRSAADDTARAARQVGSGQSEDGADRFRAGAEEFNSVASLIDSPLMLLSRNVPVVGQNVRALGLTAEAGAGLSTTASMLASEVDLEEIQLPDGSIDLALLEGFREPLAGAAEAVSDAAEVLSGLDSPWLVGPLASELDRLRADVIEADTATRLAERAAEELPLMLGRDGPRRYLLLLGNPAEARDIGGHLGNWAELVAHNGKLDTVEVGEAYDMFSPASQIRPVLGIDDIPPALNEMSPTRFPQNWGASPDLATVARLAADLYPQVRPGSPIDGVLYADPSAFAALLSFTGPVSHRGISIDSDNAVDYLTRGQFEGDEVPLRDMVREALDKFTDSRLPTPTSIADAFHSAVAEGRLQFVALDGGEHAPSDVLTLTGLDVPFPSDGDDTADLLAIVNRNANPSKIDAHLRRSIDYVVSRDRDGNLTARVVVTIHNDAPSTGAPDVVIGCGRRCPRPPGTNRTELSVLTPHDLVELTVDEQSRPARTRSEGQRLRRHTVMLEVPPGGQRTAVFGLRGSMPGSSEYRLDWFRQPLVGEDIVRLVWNGTAIELGPQRWNRLEPESG